MGRPLSVRPRDELGRPLPRDADGVAGVPDDIALSPADSLAQAQRLLDDGRAFHAHEVLESAWKAAPEPKRELWRGLAQLAVGLTHAQRGNAVGAVQLLRRAADRVEGYASDAPYGLDMAGLVVWRAPWPYVSIRMALADSPGVTSSHTFDLGRDAGTIDVPEHGRWTWRDAVYRAVVAVG